MGIHCSFVNRKLFWRLRDGHFLKITDYNGIWGAVLLCCEAAKFPIMCPEGALQSLDYQIIIFEL